MSWAHYSPFRIDHDHGYRSSAKQIVELVNKLKKEDI